jgi:hypothetical protein
MLFLTIMNRVSLNVLDNVAQFSDLATPGFSTNTILLTGATFAAN